jgi:hypothetical protein
METQDTNINKINKIIAFLLFAQGVYFLYITITSALSTFYADTLQIIIYSLAILNIIILISVGAGILRKKRWAIVIYWIFILLPIIFPVALFTGFHKYWLIALNSIFAAILTFFNWKRWKNK